MRQRLAALFTSACALGAAKQAPNVDVYYVSHTVLELRIGHASTHACTVRYWFAPEFMYSGHSIDVYGPDVRVGAIVGLVPDTTYQYAVTCDSSTEAVGSARTLKASGPLPSAPAIPTLSLTVTPTSKVRRVTATFVAPAGTPTACWWERGDDTLPEFEFDCTNTPGTAERRLFAGNSIRFVMRNAAGETQSALMKVP